jgi:hypothetical protein
MDKIPAAIIGAAALLAWAGMEIWGEDTGCLPLLLMLIALAAARAVLS